MAIKPFSDIEITGKALTTPRDLIVKFETNTRHFFSATSLADASEKWQAAIAQECFRASEVGDCRVYDGETLVARISYNGRVWDV